MSVIVGLSFDLPALEAFEGIPELLGDRVFCEFHCVGFNVPIPPEFSVAPLTVGGAVVGRVFGEFDPRSLMAAGGAGNGKGDVV